MRLLPLLAVLLLGCTGPISEDLPAGGGKADDGQQAAELHCLVAHVLEDRALGLRAVFDVDRQGVFTAEPDATTVHVAGGGARLGPKRFDDVELDGGVYHIEGYTLRVTDDVGVLALGDTHVATLDCRPAARAPNHDDAEPVANCSGTLFESGYCRFRSGQFAEARCCRARCEVAIVDDEAVFEDAVAARWAVDLDGVPLAAADATRVALDLGGDAPWQVGTLDFAAGAGDTLEHRPGLESYFQRFVVRSADGLNLELRIFDTSRLGVILVDDVVVSRLDCR